jgi:2-(1,2-epoxy-1,2-dihydrophenyl)acetyl-CoA isomerase
MALKLSCETDGAIAIVRLDSPERGNAFGPEDHVALCDLLDVTAAQDGVRCIVLTAAGPIFSAGADVSSLQSIDPTRLEASMLTSLAAVDRTFDDCEVPIVGAINGPCFGGSVALALKCDMLVAAETARFGFPFARLGILPDSGLTYLLPRLIGEQRTKALFMLAGDISAREALGLGLVHELCADDQLQGTALKLAKRYARMPAGSARSIRQALIRSRSTTASEQMAFEAAEQRKAVSAEDFKERLASALRPRRP